MPTIVLHNGHKNVNLNPDAGLHGSTGAAGELAWIEDFQAQSKAEFERRGYQVKLTDGSGPNQDFAGDVFIADHYDGAAGAGAYWCIARPVNDSTPAESDRLIGCIRAELAWMPWPENPGRVTQNMTYYYGFTYETQPCCIIEWGNGPASYGQLHDPALISKMVNARADALDAWFGRNVLTVESLLHSIGETQYPLPVTDDRAVKCRELVQEALKVGGWAV